MRSVKRPPTPPPANPWAGDDVLSPFLIRRLAERKGLVVNSVATAKGGRRFVQLADKKKGVELDTGLLNAGLPWTEGSIADLRAALEHGADLREVADFLCRHPMEVRAKMQELRLRFKNSE